MIKLMPKIYGLYNFYNVKEKFNIRGENYNKLD